MRGNHDKIIADLESREVNLREMENRFEQMQQSLIRQEQEVNRKTTELQVSVER